MRIRVDDGLVLAADCRGMRADEQRVLNRSAAKPLRERRSDQLAFFVCCFASERRQRLLQRLIHVRRVRHCLRRLSDGPEVKL